MVVNNVKQATTTTAYANAVKGLSLEQAKLALSTKQLSALEKEQILIKAGLLNATGKLTTGQLTAILTNKERNAEDAKALLLSTGLISAETAEATAVNVVETAKLEELVATKQLTVAEAELIAMKAKVTTANIKEVSTTTAVSGKMAGSISILGSSVGSALTKIGSGLLSFASAHPVIAALTAIVGLVGITNSQLKKYEQEQKELIENAKTLQDEYRSFVQSSSDNINSLKAQADEFEELSKGVTQYGENISLSADEYDRYKSIVAEVLGYTPELVDGYNAEGTAIANKNSLIERSIELMKEEQRQKLKEMTTDEKTGVAYEGAKAEWDDANAGYEGAYTRNDIGNILRDNEKSSGVWVESDIIKALDLEKEWEDYKKTHTSSSERNLDNFTIDNIEAVAKAIKENKQALTDLTDTKGKKVFSEEEINSLIDKANTWQEQYAEWQQEIEDSKHGMDDQFSLYAQRADGYDDLTDAQRAFVSEYIKATGDIIDADGKILSEDEMIEKAESYEKFVDKLATSPEFADARKKINELFALDSSTISAGEYEKQVNDILEELQTKFELTDDEVKDFKIALGFDFIEDGSSTRVSELVTKVQDKLKDDFDDKVNELTLEELEIAANLTIDPEETRKNITSELKSLEQGGSVNLTLRPQIDTSELNAKGWDAGEGTATVFSSTYSNEDGTVAVNFTPIIADPKTGEYLGVLSPDELQDYAEGVIAGTRKDDLNLQIGAKFEGKDAIQQAEDSAIKVHELHERYFVDGDILLSWDELITKIKEVNSQNPDEITVSFSEAFNAEDFKNHAEKLKELAISGQISPEVLTSTEAYRQLLKLTGLTAEEATEKIRQIAVSESSLSDILGSMQSHSDLIAKVNQELSDNGKISFSSLQSIAKEYPTLEKYVTDYLNGVEGASDNLINALNDGYKTDLTNYSEYYTIKQGNDKTWWDNYLTNASSWVNEIANAYSIDLKNYANYLEAKAEIENRIKKAKETSSKAQTQINIANNPKSLGALSNIFGISPEHSKDIATQIKEEADIEAYNLSSFLDEIVNSFKAEANNITADFKSSDYIGKSSSSKDNTDYWKEAFEKELADLQYKRDMEKISEEQYYSSLKALNDKYFKGKEKYLEDYRKYEVEIYDYTSGLHKKEFEDKLADLKHALEMNEITQAQYYKTLDALNKEYFANNEKYLEEYEQYTEEVYKGMLSVQEDALESINDLIDLRIDMIKDLKEEEIKAHEETLEAEKEKLEAINKQIDARKEAIELMKDEKSHSEEMTEKNKVISDLQVQIDRLSLDTSATAQKKRRELQEQLVEAQKDLADYISDYEYDKAMEALDNEAENAEKEYEIFEEEINDKIEAIETFLDDEKLLLSTAMSELDGMNNTLFENMKTWAMETTGEVQNIVDTWKEAQKALELYNGTFDVVATKTALEQANSEKKVIDKVNTGSGNKGSNNVPVTSTVPTQPVIKQPTQPTSTKSGGDGIPKQGDKATFSSGKYYGTSWGEGASGSYNLAKQVYITSVNEKGTHPYHISTSPTLGNGDLGWVKLSQLKGYAKGTLGTHKDELSWVDENGDEIIIRAGKTGRLDYLTKGTSVIPADISKNLIEWGKIPPTAFKFDIPDYSSMVKNVSNNNESTVVNIGDIIIQGNAGNLTKSDLNLFKDDIVNKVYASLQKNRVKSGRY